MQIFRSLQRVGPAVILLGTGAFAQTAPPIMRPANVLQQDASKPPQTQQPPASNRPEVPGPTPLPNAPSATERDRESAIEQREQSRKILGVIPFYGVTNRRNAPPLTPNQKFSLMGRSLVNPFEFVATGFQAALAQATDEFPDYGQGAAGYGKRYGAAYADQASSQFFANYFYPVVFKEDPRYFRLGRGSVFHRTLYSVAQEFSAVKDDRSREFNFSTVLGAFTSGAISNAYYPRADRGFGDTMGRSAIALAYGSVGGLVDEFWPDIQQKLAQRRQRKKARENQN